MQPVYVVPKSVYYRTNDVKFTLQSISDRQFALKILNQGGTEEADKALVKKIFKKTMSRLSHRHSSSS